MHSGANYVGLKAERPSPSREVDMRKNKQELRKAIDGSYDEAIADLEDLSDMEHAMGLVDVFRCDCSYCKRMRELDDDLDLEIYY
jgi:hypothetical protein